MEELICLYNFGTLAGSVGVESEFFSRLFDELRRSIYEQHHYTAGVVAPESHPFLEATHKLRRVELAGRATMRPRKISARPLGGATVDRSGSGRAEFMEVAEAIIKFADEERMGRSIGTCNVGDRCLADELRDNRAVVRDFCHLAGGSVLAANGHGVSPRAAGRTTRRKLNRRA